MASVNDFPARCRVLGMENGLAVLNPIGTNYELRLHVGEGSVLTAGQRVEGVIRVMARKVWTVSAGGNFISPLFGPPRVIQGRIVHLEEGRMVVHAGVPLVVELPAVPSGLELECGPLALNALANATVLPGAQFELSVGSSTQANAQAAEAYGR